MVAVTLVARPARVDLGGRTVSTWTFNGTVPGPQITLAAGDTLRARVVNQLPAPLTVHWHGIAIRNDMDGVPDLTQKPIQPGGSYTYEFTVSDPGTYFYHSHYGTQLDRGLYGPLIVTDPGASHPNGQRDVAIMLDDWIDGTGQTPDQVLHSLQKGGAAMGRGSTGGMAGMAGMNMGPSAATTVPSAASGQSGAATAAGPLGSDTGDVNYPLYLINGKSPQEPDQIAAAPGRTVRLRLVNAGSDTAFRVAVAGRALTVVATDGYPVDPVTVDTLIVGMGERYDVVVTAPRTGAVPLVALPEGKQGEALAVLRSGPGPNPTPDVQPSQLAGRLLTYADLHATSTVALDTAHPDVTYRVTLTGGMNTYKWGIGAANGTTLRVRQGQRVRLVIENQTMMWHPIHLHGHTFQLDTGNGIGPRKDTVIVPAMGTVTVDFVADNPGQWAFHCHNIYHAEAGMLTTLNYVK